MPIHKNLNVAIKILPIVFGLHNLEEAFSMEKWSILHPNILQSRVHTLQFVIAVLLFSVLGFIVVYCNSFFKSKTQHFNFIIAFTGMLFLNGLTHLFMAVYLKAYVPGLLTALIFNLPITIFILYGTIQYVKRSFKNCLINIVLGGIVGLGLVYVFLEVGKWISVIISSHGNTI